MNNARLYDGVRPVPINGTVKIEEQQLNFFNPDLQEPYRFPLQYFCEVQKMDGKLLMEFRPPRKKSNILIEILNVDFEKDVNDGFQQCGGITAFRQLIWHRLPASFWLIMLIILLPLGYLFYTQGAEELHRFIPVEWEEDLGENVEKQLAPFFPPIPDHPRRKVLQGMAEKLADPESPYVLDVSVVDSPEVNAFALPGGKIMVTRGLLDFTQNPDEWAAVLSHEVAHVEKRHVMRALSRATGTLYLFSMTVGGGLEGFGTAEQALELSSAILNLQYSRSMEREADRVGLEKLLALEKDPRGFLSFFQKLHKTSATHESLSLLSTHPMNTDRIRRLEKQIPENQTYSDWSLE